jgi:uncharacterized protein (TIGR03083 family)
VNYDEHITLVERDVDAMATAVAAGPLNARVPTCPRWDVAALMRHVGEFTGFWTHVLCEGTGRPKTPAPDLPDGGPKAVSEWYRGLGDSLLGELRATPADNKVWSWIEDRQDAAFIARRCANELAVHRFDAESARGTQQPIDAALAADSIEEIFVMTAAFAARGEDAGRGKGESLGLEPTDRPERWVITMAPGGLEVDRSSDGVADLTVSGSMSDLELVCYERLPLGDVDMVGDSAALEAWYRAFHFG